MKITVANMQLTASVGDVRLGSQLQINIFISRRTKTMQFFFVPSASAETLVAIIKETMLEVREVNFASHLRNLKDFIISIIIISGLPFVYILSTMIRSL